MDPNNLAAPIWGMAATIEIPEGWPEHGELNGEKILLRDIGKIPSEQWPEIVIDVEGQGKIRPWRFETDGADIYVADDGAIVI
tara:strand:- start:197 stop:445 length:249 start_codon:yes stop_codon:yes gene_type:complete